MTIQRINGINLEIERTGNGDSLVFVHGSWGDHHNWDRVVPLVADRFDVVTYDRRGHSRSDDANGPGRLDDDTDDLAAVIDHIGGGPAHVVGGSYGGSIALRLTASNSGHVRTVTAHEPPLFALLGTQSTAAHGDSAVAAVLALIESGAHQEAARLFVDTVALGPGAWDQLPAQTQATFIANAATWLDEQRTAGWDTLDLDGLTRASQTVNIQLTLGTQHSPTPFGQVLDVLESAVKVERRMTIHGAGHVPHLTHPQQVANLIFDIAEATSSRT